MNPQQKQEAYGRLLELSEKGGSLVKIAEELVHFEAMLIAMAPPFVPTVDGKPIEEEKDKQADRPVHRETPDGSKFLCGFTDQKIMGQYCLSNNEVQRIELLNSVSQSWEQGCFRTLVQGYDGLIIDPEEQYSLTFDRAQVAFLYGQFHRRQFLEHQTGHTLWLGNQLFVHDAGEHQLCYAYLTRLAAQAGLEWLCQNIDIPKEKLTVVEQPIPNILAESLDMGTTLLFVNAGHADQYPYYKSDIVDMALQAGLIVDVEDSGSNSIPEDEDRTLVRIVEQTPPQPLVRTLNKSDHEFSSIFGRLRHSATQHLVEPWQFLESVAFDMSFYLASLPQAKYGLHWPAFWQNDQGKFTVVCFCRERELEQEFSETGGRIPQVHHLRGVEAFRWINAVPVPFELISFDGADDEPWMNIPNWWSLIPLLPLMVDNVEFQSIPSIAQLDLEVAHPLQPAIAKAIKHSQQKESISDSLLKSKTQETHSFPLLGQVLNITRPHLAILSSWENESIFNPSPEFLLHHLLSLYRDEVLSASELGEAMAEVPRFWMLSLGTAGKTEGYARDAESGAFLVFSSEQTAQAYREDKGLEHAKIFPILSGFGRSMFHFMQENGEHHFALDPNTDNMILLPEVVIKAGSDYLNRKLAPRIPNFVAKD